MKHIRGGILRVFGPILAATIVLLPWSGLEAAPPAINPFGQRPTVREDAIPGYVETSDGCTVVGMVYLTRDKRLKIQDNELKRQRLVPLRVVRQIECNVKREWMEREWRFKENANDVKYFTGREYPARIYEYTVTLKDGRTITGPLSGIVYVKQGIYKAERPGTYRPDTTPERFLLHKRSKGEFGDDLKSLTYTKLIKLGDDAIKEGRRKAAKYRRPATPNRPTRGSS